MKFFFLRKFFFPKNVFHRKHFPMFDCILKTKVLLVVLMVVGGSGGDRVGWRWWWWVGVNVVAMVRLWSEKRFHLSKWKTFSIDFVFHWIKCQKMWKIFFKKCLLSKQRKCKWNELLELPSRLHSRYERSKHRHFCI